MSFHITLSAPGCLVSSTVETEIGAARDAVVGAAEAITAAQNNFQSLSYPVLGWGPDPLYTINATEPEELAEGMAFANENNIRLVVRTTGHDIMGRSEGYGALQVWVKYLQKGITYHHIYIPSNQCGDTNWTGATFTIAGSDQVLEAQVVLAHGNIVTPSACQHPDLYFAIRDALGNNTDALLEAITDIHTEYPAISDTIGYVHAVAAMGKPLKYAGKAFDSLLRKLQKYNSTLLFVSVQISQFPSYPVYYRTMSGVHPPVGPANGALTSRMIGKTTSHQESTVAVSWADEANAQAVKNDITFKKGEAMRALTPPLGTYMNEASTFAMPRVKTKDAHIF
ncbi:hypothetical protein BBP40_008162 [Aspergillus hancockii]|nr:hypothetical protein BBP40_008162 [Aspergillus hancockii]